MSNPTNAYRTFLTLVDKAVELGLVLYTTKGKIDISYSTVEKDSLMVYAREYQLTSWNGYGGGHELMCVYTLQAAQELKKIYDKYTTDTNIKRYTTISFKPAYYLEKDLKNFIKLRKEENKRK